MQIRAEHIDLAAVPVPAPRRDLFLVTVEMAGTTVRPRTLEFVVSEGCAMALWRLRNTGRLATKFAMVATGQRVGFLNLEEVRFDAPGAHQYTVAAISKIAKFRY